MQALSPRDQAALEVCREGVRVETPSGADRQTAFLGRPRDPPGRRGGGSGGNGAISGGLAGRSRIGLGGQGGLAGPALRMYLSFVIRKYSLPV